MLNQKDNDFDDLFRRASDKYPLRTDSADWDRMSAALENPSPDLPETPDTDKRRRRRFIWLFLLLPLGGAGYYVLHPGGHGKTVVTAPAPVSGSGAVAEKGGSGTVEENGSSVKESGTVADNGGHVNAGGSGVVTGDSVDAGSVRNGVGAKAAGAGANGAVKTGGSDVATRDVLTPVEKRRGKNEKNGKNGTGRIKSAGSGGMVGDATNGARGGVRSGKVGDATTDEGVDVAAGGARGGMIGGATSGAIIGGNGVGNGKSSVESRVANYPVNRALISKDYNLTVNVVALVVVKDSSKAKPKASSKQKSSFLYAGLLAAPDLSTVKFQSTKGVGTTFSLLLGYQFNKRWAVETGVSIDRKRYYTDAEYFDTKGLWIPQYGKLKNVDGTCYMWEVPLNIRYNFSQTKSTKWFATAGLSTYFMTRENYNYNYTKNYGTVDTSSNWNIKKPSQYWFSIINLSAGYEHRLGGIGNLRIEPYLRIPLSGLGTGKLNILSTGINIGITRKLW